MCWAHYLRRRRGKDMDAPVRSVASRKDLSRWIEVSVEMIDREGYPERYSARTTVTPFITASCIARC